MNWEKILKRTKDLVWDTSLFPAVSDFKKQCHVSTEEHLTNHAIKKKLDDLYKPLWASDVFN